MVINKAAQLPALPDAGGLLSYFERIKSFPVLSEEEEQALILDFKQNHNLEAAHRLVVSHLRLAAKIALTYRHYGLPLADLISEANIGLMQAVKKFDLEKKVRLSTYAIWWIKAAINDFILRSWSLVKIGTVAAQKKLFYNLGRIKAKLGIYENKELEPSVVKQIAGELVVDEKDVVEMNRRLGGDRRRRRRRTRKNRHAGRQAAKSGSCPGLQTGSGAKTPDAAKMSEPAARKGSLHHPSPDADGNAADVGGNRRQV